jgi:hypothetical protein
MTKLAWLHALSSFGSLPVVVKTQAKRIENRMSRQRDAVLTLLSPYRFRFAE